MSRSFTARTAIPEYLADIEARVEAGFARLEQLTEGDIADPGAAGTLDLVDDDGNAKGGQCLLVSAGAETRAVPTPTAQGQELILYHKTDGGDITATFASPINEAGNNTAVFSAVGDLLFLKAVKTAAGNAPVYRWRVLANDTVVLSTV